MKNSMFRVYSDAPNSFIEVIVMVDIQTISVVIAAASVVVGVVTFIMNSRQEAKRRAVEFLFQCMQRGIEANEAWIDIMFIQDWNTVEELQEVRSINPKSVARFQNEGNYFNSIGLLLKEKVVNPEFLFSLLTPTTIISTWRRYEPIVKEQRKNTNDPMHRKHFEYLANEVKKRYPEVTLIPKTQMSTK